jgi:hypothetical protein
LPPDPEVSLLFTPDRAVALAGEPYDAD